MEKKKILTSCIYWKGKWVGGTDNVFKTSKKDFLKKKKIKKREK